MTTWSEGYVSTVDYTHGYFHEINPHRVRLALLLSGIRPPEIQTACELGFGQGLSINIHAAASDVRWYGTDFMPAQVQLAKEMAQASGADIGLVDDAFSDYCARSDLPNFDFIALHGIWSWVSETNRSIIVDFAKRKLKPGGVLYVSYNTQPGWAAMGPMRDLMSDYAKVMTPKGVGVTSQIDASLTFLEDLIAVQPNYIQANPMVERQLKELHNRNRRYLAHEYFNQNWTPMPFARTAEALALAKLDLGCSADWLAQVDALQLTPNQQAFLAKIPDATLRQSVRDICINQAFRKDYWVKGPRRLSSEEQRNALQDQSFVLVVSPDKFPESVSTPMGEAKLQSQVYTPLLQLLSDHQPRSLGRLHESLHPHLSFKQMLQAIMVLTGMGIINPVQAAEPTQTSVDACRQFNRYVMQRARFSEDLSYLCSPLTGGGVLVHRFELLFLWAKQCGFESAAQWADHAWQALSSQGETISIKGQVLTTDAENLAALNRHAQTFATTQLPILKALQVV